MSAKLEEGTVFAGRYRVVRCLAAGGMGAVYEVVHLETDRRRALKVMHPHLFQSDEMRERFKLEARIAAQVDSEYIVDVSDAGVDVATQMPFMVMELLRGEDLNERLKRLKRLPSDEVVTYMQQAAWALDRTHAASIVHRDLKPGNLFLTMREDGTPRIKILDFGVAKLVADGVTAAGATQSLGTPLYMAPEQFRASKRLTPAADIYALTLMTYTLLVGEAYWAEESKSAGDVIAFAMAVVNGPQEAAGQRAARCGVELPPGFDAWFAKGTAVNPTDRFPSATEAVQGLRAVGGATGFGGMASAMTPSDGGMYSPESRSGIPSARMLQLAVTSTAPSLMKAGQGKRNRLPFIAGTTALGLVVLGLGAWLTVRPAASPQVSSAAPVASSVAPAPSAIAPAAITAAPIEVVPAGISASVAPSASAPGVAVPGKPVAAAPSARAVVVGKTPPPAASEKKPPASTPLLGRD